jgi:hypothetical protein
MRSNILFGTVLCITGIAAIGSFWLANQPALSDAQRELLIYSNDTWKLGVASIFGFIGGKA